MKITEKMKRRLILLLTFSFIIVILIVWKLSIKSLFIILSYILFMCLVVELQVIYESSVMYKDEVTPIYSRKKLRVDLEKVIKLKKPFAVIYIDFRKFKYINDTYGHAVGNIFLNKFGVELNKLPSNFLSYRNGGDEFVVIVKDYTNINEEVKKIFDFKIKYKEVLLRYNAGVALYPIHGDSADVLLSSADHAMYNAKKQDIEYYIAE